jgi:hypothetical protein
VSAALVLLGSRITTHPSEDVRADYNDFTVMPPSAPTRDHAADGTAREALL